jgi:hypothetical protein
MSIRPTYSSSKTSRDPPSSRRLAGAPYAGGRAAAEAPKHWLPLSKLARTTTLRCEDLVVHILSFLNPFVYVKRLAPKGCQWIGKDWSLYNELLVLAKVSRLWKSLICHSKSKISRVLFNQLSKGRSIDQKDLWMYHSITKIPLESVFELGGHRLHHLADNISIDLKFVECMSVYCHNLRSAVFCGFRMQKGSPAIWRALIGNSRSLTRLNISDFHGANVPEILKEIGRATELEELMLTGKPNIRDLVDEHFAPLGQLPRLKILWLSGFFGLTDRIFLQLAGAPNLAWLYLIGCPGVTGEQLEKLWVEFPAAAFSKLDYLHFFMMPNFTPAGYGQLARRCTALTRATLDDMNDTRLRAFSAATQLWYLALTNRDGRLIKQAVGTLRLFTQLESFSITTHGVDFGDGKDFNQIVQGNPRLKKIELTGKTQHDQSRLRKAQEAFRARSKSKPAAPTKK